MNIFDLLSRVYNLWYPGFFSRKMCTYYALVEYEVDDFHDPFFRMICRNVISTINKAGNYAFCANLFLLIFILAVPS